MWHKMSYRLVIWAVVRVLAPSGSDRSVFKGDSYTFLIRFFSNEYFRFVIMVPVQRKDTAYDAI